AGGGPGAGARAGGAVAAGPLPRLARQGLRGAGGARGGGERRAAPGSERSPRPLPLPGGEGPLRRPPRKKMAPRRLRSGADSFRVSTASSADEAGGLILPGLVVAALAHADELLLHFLDDVHQPLGRPPGLLPLLQRGDVLLEALHELLLL